MKRDERTVWWIGRVFASLALAYAAVIAACAAAVFHNGALVTVVVAAYIAGDIFGAQRGRKDFYRMRDEAEESLRIANAALHRCELLDNPPFSCAPEGTKTSGGTQE